MEQHSLLQPAIFLAAAAIAAPLAKRLKVGSVLGYLGAGILIGASGLIQSHSEVKGVLHVGEFGVVLLLFVIGLELRPQRLLSMRSSIFGLGSAQVFTCGVLLAIASLFAGPLFTVAILIGFALSLSSTAFVIQVLDEKGELSKRHGRMAFSILLFQDLFAIPLIAITPFLVAQGAQGQVINPLAILKAVGTIMVVVILGKFILSRMYKLIAATGVSEAMTASALLTVVSVTILMEWADLSAALGAFIAGALLADSPYRHQLQADLKPFEGLLLGLFFTAIGISLNIDLLLANPWIIIAMTCGLILIKVSVLFILGRIWGLSNQSARRMAFVLCQGGEFAFVIFTTAVNLNGAVSQEMVDWLTLVVTLSMIATPFLLLFDDFLNSILDRYRSKDMSFEEPPESRGHVIIAGFGRFGQVFARVLQAKHIPFTALDKSPEHVDFVKRYGNKIYYGDATRLEVLRAAQIEKAAALIIAIDDVEGSLRLAQMVKQNYPDLPLFVRARNRRHVYQLLHIGVENISRETFLSALDLTKEVLIGLGEPPSRAARDIETFRDADRRLLYEDYKHYTDIEKLQARAKTAAKHLEELFERDTVDAEKEEVDKQSKKNKLAAPSEDAEKNMKEEKSASKDEDAKQEIKDVKEEKTKELISQ
ncbi:MAG: cation:proton antiporter [Methyloligellaceae bacterium]